MANFSIKTAATTMASGNVTRCTGGVNCTTRAVSSPTRAIGHTTSSTATVRYTTITPWFWKVVLITQISICWMIIGSFMKVCLRMIPNKAEEGSS